jgi:uncharacterized protein (TIRG00374 family)
MKTRLLILLSSRWFRIGVGIILSGLAIYLAFKNVDLLQVWGILKKIRVAYVLLALLSIGINNLSKSIRWKVLAGETGKDIRQGKYFAVFLVGQMLNIIFPGRIGDLGRAYVLGGLGPGRTFILGTILVEKVIDSLSYAMLFLFLLLLIPLPEWVGQSLIFFVGVTLLVSAGVVVLAYRRSFLLKILEFATRFLPGERKKGIQSRINAGLTSLDIIQDRVALAKLGFWTLVVWGTAILNNHLVLQAFGLELSWTASLLILVVLQAGISIPSVPGKIGIFEYTCILALAVFRVDPSLSLTYGLVLHGLVFIPTTLAGLIAFWGMGLTGERQKFREGVV